MSLEALDHNMQWMRVGSKVTFEIAQPETMAPRGKIAFPPVKVGPLRIVGVSPPGHGASVMVAIPTNSTDENLALLRHATAQQRRAAVVQPDLAPR